MYYSPSKNRFYADFIEQYRAAGNWPNDAIEATAEEWQVYGQSMPPDGYCRGVVDGRPGWVPIPPAELEVIAKQRRSAIEYALSATLDAGMAYTLPNGAEDVIQTRPDQDEANLLGLAIEARDLRNAGETGAVMSLRAKSNTVYSLTPEEMIALTDAAKNFKQALLAKSWALKDQITAAEAADDRAALEAITWDTDTTTEETA